LVLGDGFGWNVVDGLPGAVAVFHPDDRMILFTNRAWDALFDYEPGSLVGRPIEVVNAPGEQAPAAVAAEIVEALRVSKTWHGTIHNVRRSGQEFWTRADMATVRDPQLGDLLVTVQREVPREADDDAQRPLPLGELEELARIGTWELDLDQQTVQCSAQMLRMHGVELGSDPVPLPVVRVLHFVHPDDRQLLIDAFDRIVRTGELPELEYRVVHPDTGVHHLVIRGIPIGAEGRARRFGGVSLDVTDRYQRERDLALALVREQQATADLRSADELKDLFLRALSHDLRTPLAVIHGFASALASRGERISPEERVDFAERIVRSALRLDRQLTDLLDLDRLARGVLEPARHSVELRHLARGVVEGLELAARVTVAGDPVQAFVDPSQVERILENLIANAARHTPEGSHIEVRCEALEDGALISVDDNGPGVPEDLREEVFDVFRKVDPLSRGTGVGLSLVRRFAELHGGRAWVEERPGGGAAFRVFLPER
jgi:signal transduction histidine kinase